MYSEYLNMLHNPARAFILQLLSYFSSQHVAGARYDES